MAAGGRLAGLMGLALMLGFGSNLVGPSVAWASPSPSVTGLNHSHLHSHRFHHAMGRQSQSSRPIAQAALPGSTGTPLGGPWSSIGPHPIAGQDSYGASSGRVTTLAIDPSNHNTIYAGAADGGVWKSTDAGATWSPLTDTQTSLAIGALAIDPRASQTIYAGTGEGNACQDCLPSQGVLKSVDGGASWTLLAQSFFTTHHRPGGRCREWQCVRRDQPGTVRLE